MKSKYTVQYLSFTIFLLNGAFKNCQIFCLNSLLLTKKKIVTTPVTKAKDSPNHWLIKYIILICYTKYELKG